MRSHCLPDRFGCKGVLTLVPFIALLGSSVGAAQNGEERRSAWRHENAPARICFYRESDDFILTQVPVHVTNKFVSAVAACSGDTDLKSDVLFNDGEKLAVLIDATAAPGRKRVDLYLIAGDNPAQASAQPMREPTPLHGSVGRTAGMDYPRNREEADSLTTRLDRSPTGFRVAGFDDLGATFKDWYNGDWRRKSHLVDLSSWILVPKEGKYIFGLAGTAPGWLDVGDSQIAEHPANQPFDKWTASAPVHLKAGLHPVSVRTVCRKKIDTGVAWKREGEEGTAKDVVMITGVKLSKGRLECAERNVHPFFTSSTGEAYRFAGIDALFVPCRFLNRSACWSGEYDLRWNINGGFVGESNGFSRTIASVNLPAEVALTVTARGSAESEQFVEKLDYRGPVWNEFAISSRMSGVPAACYGEDRIHPIVRVKTSANDDLLYRLDSEIELVSGKKITRSDDLRTAQGWGRQYLSPLSAGSVKSVSWSLKHCDCELTSGRVLFQRDPFGVVPDAVSGELFKHEDDFVVLVVSRRSAEREITAAPAVESDKVLFLDGFIFDGQSVPALCRQGEGGDDWNWQSVSELEWSPERSGTSLLQSFTRVNEALAAGTVIYAPSLGCIASEGGAGGFERRLAAMCGLLTHSGESSPRVILVAPPPFEELPGHGLKTAEGDTGSELDARRVAEIILRVADVYGVETVDLFTAFEIVRKTAEHPVPLVSGAELTTAGCELAAEIIRRKL